MTRSRILLLIVAAFLSAGAHAQILPSSTPEADSIAFAKVRARMDSIRQYRPTVALVLAGGGARGMAHLGVMRYMEELGIPVDIVVGTSMGGLVAGLYALGYSQSQLDSLVRDINWPHMMSDDIPGNYIDYQLKKYRDRFVVRVPWKYDKDDAADLIRRRQKKQVEAWSQEAGHGSADRLSESVSTMGLGIGTPDGYLFGLNIRNLLSSVSVGYQDSISFANLPIPYANVATDMYAMTPKYWTGGSITSALRSTMAIPLYFRAVRENGEILLDGGMRNNFPSDLARAMGADIVIGSDMSVRREMDRLNSSVDLLFQGISMMASITDEPTMEMTDLIVNHPLPGYSLLSFDEKSISEIIRQGYENSLDHKEEFMAVAAEVSGKGLPAVSHPAPAVNLAQRKVHVKEVRFTGIADGERDRILHPSDYPKDGMYDRDIVEKMLHKIYGSNAFEAVTYRMEGSSEPYTLVFDCQKGQVNDFAVGIRADTDEYVSAMLHLGLGTRRLGGPRLTADVKLGSNPSVAIDGSVKSRIGLPTVGITLRNRLFNTIAVYMAEVDERLFSMASDIYLADSRLRFGSMKAGITAEMDPYEHYLSEEEVWEGYDWKSYWLSAFGTLKHDTFDDGYFPTRGVRLSLDARYVFKGYSIDLDPALEHPEGYTLTHDGSVPGYASVMAGAEAAFSIGQRFSILPKLYFGWYSLDMDYMNPKHVVSVGGFLPGRYAERQMPFFGFPIGCRTSDPFSVMSQLDLRYSLDSKNFLTLRGGIFDDDTAFNNLFVNDPSYAFGMEYSRQTIVGPLKVALQWCNALGLTAHATIGFDF